MLYCTAGLGAVLYSRTCCCTVQQDLVLYCTASIVAVLYSWTSCCTVHHDLMLYCTAGLVDVLYCTVQVSVLFYTAGLLAVVYSKSSCLVRLARWQCSVGHAEYGGRKQKKDGNAQSEKLEMAAGRSGTMAMLSWTCNEWHCSDLTFKSTTSQQKVWFLYCSSGLVAALYNRCRCCSTLQVYWLLCIASQVAWLGLPDGNAQLDMLKMAAGSRRTMAMLSLTSSGWRQDAVVRWQCSVGQDRDGGRMQGYDGNAQLDKLEMAAGCSSTMAMLSWTCDEWHCSDFYFLKYYLSNGVY